MIADTIASTAPHRARRWAPALALSVAAASGAAAPALEPGQALGESQAAIGHTLQEHTLRDVDGRPVRLSSFRGKPLLVSFVYTGCFQACPVTTRSLQQAVAALETRFGTSQFNVASIGFNLPADSPQAMKAFAARYGITYAHWSFLSPDAADVDALTREFGFRFAPDAAGFDHVSQVTLVDAQGRIAQQVYGQALAADALGEPLTRLLAGRPLPPRASLSDLVDRVRILCTVYDPATGTYRVDYGLALEIAGGATFALSMLAYFLNEWRGRRAARRMTR
jgi:protein SCO1/2